MNTRFLSLALSAAILTILALALPAGAGAFGVANVKFEQSTLQASGHPTATLSFDRTGTEAEDVKDMDIDLPAGVFANPEAANPKCTETQFTSDKCPANSQVGDVQITVKAMGLLDMTINGSVYVLNPQPTETATMGLTLRPDQICILIICAVPQKIFLKTGANLRTYGDQGLTASAPTSPNKATIKIPLILFTASFDSEITINKVKFRFYDRTGQYVTKRVCGGFLNLFCKDVTTPPSGPYFFRQSASCTPATVKVRLLSYQNVSASNQASYTPTGCNNVPFTPSVVINPHSKDAGVPTQLDFIMSEPEADAAIQQSLPKYVDVSLPKGSGLNLAGLAGVEGCTEYQLTHPDPNTGKSCPDASIIGRADVFSKYLPGPIVGGQPTAGLAGNVYAMGVGNLVPIAVELKGRGNTVVLFRGVMGTRGEGADARVYSTFDQIPELPYASIKVTIQKAVYKNPHNCGRAAISGSLTGFSGKTVSSDSGYDVVNCAAPPNTILDSGPPAVSSIVQPKFTFHATLEGTPFAGATFECSIDGAAGQPCSSPFQSEPLATGDHTFSVTAVNGVAKDPTPATVSFRVNRSGFVVTPSIEIGSDPDHPTAAARSHPDATASFDIAGGNPQQVSLRMPDGFVASLSARTQCPLAEATKPTPNCDEDSKIGLGSVTVNYKAPDPDNPGQLKDMTATAVGAGYLTTSPTSNDAAGVMATAEFEFGRITAVGGAYLVNNGRNQYLTLREIPQVVVDSGGNATQVNVTNLTVELDGSRNEFVTAPSSCDTPSSFISTGLDWGEPSATPPVEPKWSEVFDVPFTTTGCESLSFAPQVNQVLSHPAAGAESGVTATVVLGDGDAGIRSMRMVEPPSLGPNNPAFGQPLDQCPINSVTDEGAFDPSACASRPQAKVGTMTLHTPLLPYDLDGSVYLIEASPLPWLGVAFNKPGIAVGLVGITSTPKVKPTCNPLTTVGGCQTQIAVDFDGIPDVPITQVDFVLDGPSRVGIGGVVLSGKMLRVAAPTDPACLSVSPAKANFVPYASELAAADRVENIAISGCI